MIVPFGAGGSTDIVGPDRGRGHGAVPGRFGHRREPGRRRRHRRHAGGGQRGARRLHDHDGDDQHPRRGPAHRRDGQVRPGQGLRARRHDRGDALRPGDQPEARREFGQGADRLREEEPGQAQLRLRRAGLHHAPGGPHVPGRHRHEDGARPLQEQCRLDQGGDDRRGAGALRLHAGGACADQGRHHQGPGCRFHRSLARAARRDDHAGGRRPRLSRDPLAGHFGARQDARQRGEPPERGARARPWRIRPWPSGWRLPGRNPRRCRLPSSAS